MRAVLASQAGGPEVLTVVEMETPEPGPGQALVRVAAVGVNFAETMQRRGNYPVPGFALPAVLGSEAAGTVERLGPGAEGPPVGTRVAAPLFAAMQLTGAYADHLVCDAHLLAPIPDALAFEAAAALMVQGLTARFLVEQTPPRDRTVLVHAAAGGVGSYLVQFARRAGAKRVVATAGGEHKLAVARRLGADAAIDYRDADWPEQALRAAGGEGPDVIYDAVGGAVFKAGLGILAPAGTLVTFGALGGALPTLGEAEVSGLIFKNQSVTGFALYVLLEDGVAQRTLAELFALAAAGEIEAPIGGRYPLEQAAEAHRALEARETTGKLVLTP